MATLFIESKHSIAEDKSAPGRNPKGRGSLWVRDIVSMTLTLLMIMKWYEIDANDAGAKSKYSTRGGLGEEG